MFYEMQKVEDSFKYTEMELGSMVLASHVLSLWNNFCQRARLISKLRKCRNKGKESNKYQFSH